MGALTGQVAIVTGASSGIGWATALMLGEAGASLVVAARREDRLRSLAEQLESRGAQVLVCRTDVADRGQVQAMVKETLDRFESVQMLINNAGIMPLSPVTDLRVEDWERMVDVNVKGVLYCVAAVLPTMLASRSGHIVNVGSLAGRRPFPTGSVYSATKFAVRSISAGLRLELSPSYGIRVTDVEPGVVATELPDGIPDADLKEQFLGPWQSRKPLESEDVARAVLYAVSQPAHVNVNEILVRPTEQET